MAELTQEQKDKAAKIAARVEELKAYAGKTFKRKGDTGPTTFKVLAYAGVGIKDGREFHTFQVERKNPSALWTPPATQFLEDHEEITPNETATEKEIA
jgi:hypothetical protein